MTTHFPAEALLAKAGVITTMGSVDKGTTVCDFDPLEKTYHHSLNASLVHFQHRDTRIHLIDTPGLPDFVGRAISALPAVETAAIVVSAQNGIEMITTRMMQWAARRELCRMIISIGTASETCAPTSLTFPQAMSDMPVIPLCEPIHRRRACLSLMRLQIPPSGG